GATGTVGAWAAGACGTGSNESGQLGIACAGVTGSSSSDGGGQAGIACSVGGSGGQMSVSSGGAGADSDAGGQVDFVASAATARGGSVMCATVSSGSGGSADVNSPAGSVAVASSAAEASTGEPGSVGTVRAHSGAFLPPLPFDEGSDLDESGSAFPGRSWGGTVGAIGGVESKTSSSESITSPAASSGGATGLVCAQTGVVSPVGTARAG